MGIRIAGTCRRHTKGIVMPVWCCLAPGIVPPASPSALGTLYTYDSRWGTTKGEVEERIRRQVYFRVRQIVHRSNPGYIRSYRRSPAYEALKAIFCVQHDGPKNARLARQVREFL